MTSTRVVVIGAGKMGAHHARVFSRAKGATLAGVLDVDAHAAEKVARDCGATPLRTLDEAIERADLVVIATPTALHFAQARRALSAGRAVLVEKPLAASAADARALGDAARASGAALFVGHSERFNAVVRALVQYTKGETVTRIETRRMAFAPAEELCVNLAVHDIDLVALLSRAPVSLVSATGGAEAAELALRAGDASALAWVERRSSNRARTIVVRTTSAVFRGDMLAGSLERDGIPVAVDALEPLALQAESTLAAVRGEVVLVATAVEGAEAVEVAERAASSLSDQRVSAAE
jgi:predicted dehydrogenase